MRTIRSGVAGALYRSTNSRPAAPAGRATPPRLPRPLPPPSLALDHPPQRLTAGGPAEPLAGTPLRGDEVLLAPRAIAGKKFGIGRWALALAPSVVALARRVRALGGRGPGGPPALGAATAVPPALGLAVHAALGGPPILAAGPPPPPSPGGGTALGATLSGLGVGGSEGLLASLEETAPPSGPARPLTGPGIAASWSRAQGSCELPAAKPRMRSPDLRSGAFLESTRPSWEYVTPQLRPARRGFQVTRPGTTRPKRGHFGLVPPSPKKWCPRRPLLTQRTEQAGCAA
jgi:hypothetical protein